MFGKLNALIQILLPKQLLTQFFGWLADRKLGFLTTWMIKLFIKLYKVDLIQAKLEDPAEYKTFNDFFARELKENQRPIDEDPNQVVFPADGTISEFGQIKDGLLFQAKGHTYSLDSLVACQTELTRLFNEGLYITTYLSPCDYHRVHMPCDGELQEMIYVPGTLFSVSPSIAENIDSLFARNERVITVFKTEFGTMAQILVGATIVGSIETVWEGKITPPRDGLIKKWNYSDQESDKKIMLKKGEEMGLFKLGSTVINLFEPNAMKLDESLKIGNKVTLGSCLAEKSE